MKIGIILPGFSASESDWCIPALLDLVRCLARSATVHVFPLRYPPAQRRYCVADAVVHPMAGGTVSGARRANLLAGSVRAVIAEHRRGAFDVLHAFWSDEPGLVAVGASAVLRVPAIVSLAGGELVGFSEIGYGGQLNRTNRWMTRISLRRAARVTAGSRYLADIAQQWHVGSRLAIVPLGVDTRLFCPSGSEARPASTPFDRDSIAFLNVASLVPVKRQVDLLTVLPQVLNAVPNARVHFIGDGPLLGELRGQAAAQGLVDQVVFHGSIDHGQLPDYYRAADLCVLSSRHEAQGMVTLEAAACGCPTVGTGVGIIPDLGSAAVAVPLDDPGTLADAIIRVASNERLRADLGRQALQRVRSRYTVEHTAEHFDELYRRVAAGYRDGASTPALK